MRTAPIKATFATNDEGTGETVAAAISGHFDYLADTWKKPFTVAIATAYVNPGGFSLLEAALAKAQSVRLLIGAEPEAPLARIRPLRDEDEDETHRALEGHRRSLEEDRNLLGFSEADDGSASRFVEWLRSGLVEVRRFEDGFLHGKAYLVDTDDEGVIAGSSNFTYAGLSRNLELNLGQYDPKDVAAVREWFDAIWDRSRDFDLAAIFEARYLPHSPYLVYLRMLWEKYGAEVLALAAADEFGLHLASFQKDGVTLARMILSQYNGVVIADGVGLGKTFVAGELIREAVEGRRQRVLVVAPATLRDGPWRAFQANAYFSFEVVSYDQLSADAQLNSDDADAPHHLSQPIDDYAMVVVDEAHAYRNQATKRAEVLNRLLEGTPPKALVMLTATPVNNSLWDLYNLLGLFVRNDAVFASAGIPSLYERFKYAAGVDPEALDPNHLFDVLSPVVVRRTRSYVKHYYPESTLTFGGREVRISFPEPHVSPINYRIDAVLPGFLDEFAQALDVPVEGEDRDVVLTASERREAGEIVLTLARYAPSAYLLADDGFEAYEGQVAGLLRSGLLKRFESSAHAFANTCEVMATSHQDFLDRIDDGWVATGQALQELSATDSDELAALVASKGEDYKARPSSDYDCDRLRADVEADRDLLLEWAARARTVTPDTDPKLAALADELAEIAKQARDDVGEPSDEGDRRKVIIFSYYADTVDWIHDWLTEQVRTDPRLAPYRDRVVAVSGNNRDADQHKAVFGFAPVTAEAPPGTKDRYDILIATDVLAEGVNLQQARHIINVDLPWNPMRLVQRHGRIDRIGSPHSKVWMRCVMPDDQLNELLGLEERLHHKIRQAARSIGTEQTIIPGSEVSDRTYSPDREIIEGIKRGESGFLDESESHTVEDFRQQLRTGLENPYLAEQVKQLPWGSGSGKAVAGADPGFVFCAKVGGDEDGHVYFRYVAMADPAAPQVVADVLACLKHAHATERTERVLDEDTHRLAYDAWTAARANIYDAWMYATDIRNLQRDVPKPLRDAAELVRSNPPSDLDQSAIDDLVDTLNSPYANRVQQAVREAIRSTEDPTDQVEAVREVVQRLSLTPPPPPEPLPLIDPEDIHLITWMAITSYDSPSISEQTGELALGDRL